jgi:membrane-associated protein
MQEWLLLQNSYIIYLALFFSLLGGAFGLPIPEDLPLICAGIVIENGSANIWLTLLSCYSAIILGDFFVFHIGRVFGPAIFKKRLFRERMSEERLAKIKKSLEKRSLIMIFLARHLFYIRTVTFLSCGALGMSRKRFFFTDAIAALISTPLMVFVGYKAAEHYEKYLDMFHKIERDILYGILALIVVYVCYKLYKKKSKKTVVQ